MDPPPPLPLPLPLHPGDVPSVPSPPPEAVTDEEIRLKYIDDLSLGESVALDTSLCSRLHRSGSLNYHDRNGLVLPENNSRLQTRLNDLSDYVKTQGMMINEEKSQVIPFNFTRKFDFTPTLFINQKQLNVVYQTKLLGTIIQSDCKWDQNTTNLVKKAKTKIFFIRRLKNMGASVETLKDIYCLFVRSGLELSAPLWHHALSKGDRRRIERCQKTVLNLIRTGPHASYEDTLTEMSLISLDQRRQQLSLKMAQKMAAEEDFKHLFPRKNGPSTRSQKTYLEPFCRSKRFKSSSIPSFITLLNNHQQAKRGQKAKN